jgi:hypothetical protein
MLGKLGGSFVSVLMDSGVRVFNLQFFDDNPKGRTVGSVS